MPKGTGQLERGKATSLGQRQPGKRPRASHFSIRKEFGGFGSSGGGFVLP